MIDDSAGRLARWNLTAESGTFEAAVAALDEIVAWLETGHHGLDDSVAAYEVGTRVAQRSQHLLATAELRISQLTVDLDDHDAVVRRDLTERRANDADGGEPEEDPF